MLEVDWGCPKTQNGIPAYLWIVPRGQLPSPFNRARLSNHGRPIVSIHHASVFRYPTLKLSHHSCANSTLFSPRPNFRLDPHEPTFYQLTFSSSFIQANTLFIKKKKKITTASLYFAIVSSYCREVFFIVLADFFFFFNYFMLFNFYIYIYFLLYFSFNNFKKFRYSPRIFVSTCLRKRTFFERKRERECVYH